MTFKTYRAKPKAPTKMGYCETDKDKRRKFLKNREKIFKMLFEDEPYLLRKYLNN